jgi:hypothetical protein
MDLSWTDDLKGRSLEDVILTLYTYKHPEISQLGKVSVNELSTSDLADELFEFFNGLVGQCGMQILTNLKELILAEKIKISAVMKIDAWTFLEALMKYRAEELYDDSLLFEFLNKFKLYNKNLVDKLVVFDLEVLMETVIDQKVVANESYLGLFEDYNLPLDDVHYVPASSNVQMGSNHGITKKRFFITGKHDNNWRIYFDGTQNGLAETLKLIAPQLKILYQVKKQHEK